MTGKAIAERRIGLALGGGGAKGLSHVAALEAFDEVGIRPVAIAGTSIGAIIGAVYAAGYSAKAIRNHMVPLFRDRADVMARLFRARAGSFSSIFSGALGAAIQMDGEALLREFWPASMPDRFADLRMPFCAVATDFYGRRAAAFREGPLRPAVAASLAVPGLVKPVEIDRRLHIDGVISNPLPFDLIPAECDLIVAVDVVGGPNADVATLQPSALEATLGAFQIMQARIVDTKLETAGPKVHVIRPDVSRYAALDFFAARRILQAAEPIRAEVKAILSPP
ncbi:MAG: patatin-like phospholipase family protein [Beijerinckiaceae bacterium]